MTKMFSDVQINLFLHCAFKVLQINFTLAPSIRPYRTRIYSVIAFHKPTRMHLSQGYIFFVLNAYLLLSKENFVIIVIIGF